MANWTDQSKIDKLFKALLNKARTAPGKQFFEEMIPTTFDLHASEIYAEAIPSTPPLIDTSVVKVYGAANRITLTMDRTAPTGIAWVALDPWAPTWSSGTGDLTKIKKNFISPKYGGGYVVKVFKGDGSQISELDNVSWIFDYKAGVLVFENAPAGQDGTTLATSVQIQVFQYIGKTVDQRVSSEDPGGEDPPPIDEPTIVVGNTLMMRDNCDKVIRVEMPDGKKIYLLYYTEQPAAFDDNFIGAFRMSITTNADGAVITHPLYEQINVDGVLKSRINGVTTDYIERLNGEDNLALIAKAEAKFPVNPS